jgi:hypothetical protein
VSVDEVLQVIRNLLSTDQTFPQHSSFQVEGLMGLLVVCARTTYFQVEVKQKDGMITEIPISPVVSNIFMEHSEKLASASVQ